MRSIGKGPIPLVASIATLLSVIAFVPPASAAPPSAPSPDGQFTSSNQPFVPPAKAGRVKKHQKFADGRTVDKFADGSTLSTAPMTYQPPPSAGVSGGVSANTTYTSNCGTSYIYLYNGNQPSGRGYNYSTGFYDTCRPDNAPTIDFIWKVKAIGPGWTKTDYDPGHPINSYSQNLFNHWATPNKGAYQTCIVPTGSIAYLSDGGFAYAADICATRIIS